VAVRSAARTNASPSLHDHATFSTADNPGSVTFSTAAIPGSAIFYAISLAAGLEISRSVPSELCPFLSPSSKNFYDHAAFDLLFNLVRHGVH
jgi:hypothetical protein